jgi:L-proline amide hydrolase
VRWVAEANRLHVYLPEIRLPTLVTSGRHDEATLLIASTIERGVAVSEWMLFEHISHMAYGKEPENYCAVLGDLLARRDNSPTTHRMSTP